MAQLNDLSRSLVLLEQHSTWVAVIEMSQSSWLAAGIVPGIEASGSKKARARSRGAAAASASLAGRGSQGPPGSHPHRGGF